MPPDERPALSVVVVSWNTRDLLRACLAGVVREAAGLAHEIVVVDNASGDGSAEMVAAEFPEARLVRNRENRGFGAACNQAIALCRGRHVLFLNPDAEPRDGAPGRLVRFLDDHPDIGIAGPLILCGPGRPGLTYGYYPSIRTALLPLLRPLLRGGSDLRSLGVVPRMPADGEPPRDVEYVSGAALTARRTALDQVGGFDERFFLYFEETDLCRRFRQGGWRVVYLPSARVMHREGASRDKRSGPAVVEFYRSFDRYLRKHHGGAYVAAVRGATILSFVVRYAAARALARGSQAEHYRESARALRLQGHA